MNKLVAALAVISLLGAVGLATDSTVTGTVGETTPVITSVSLDQVEYDPGNLVSVEVLVEDSAGWGNVENITIYAWHHSEGTEGLENWDSYVATQTTATEVNVTTANLTATFTLSQHAHYTDNVNASDVWNVKVVAVNSYGNNGSDETQSYDVTRSIGITLSDAALTVSGQPDSTGNEFTQFPVTITHTGNGDQDIAVNASNLTHATEPDIDVGNIKHHTANDYGAAVTMTHTSTPWITNMPRGTDPAAETREAYYWLDIPAAMIAGEYSGTITLTVTQS